MRRRFKSKTGVPLKKTTEDIARNRGLQKPSESGKAKRVRFDDAETNASSRGDEATQSPKSGGGPKTSEYAYFRKVKEGAVNGHSRALRKENEHLKSSKLSYLHRETNKAAEKLDPGIKDLEFCTQGESAGKSGRKLFVSPPVRIFDESNKIRRKDLAHKTKQRSPLLPETATPVRQSRLSSLLNQTEKSENQCIEKGFFSEKRKRLRQWVAHSTSSEVEKLHEKGSDLISFLLCRLIPKENENNDMSKENAKNSSKSLTVHQSDNVEKGLSVPNKRDCHNELPKISSGRSSEIVPREWDYFESGFPSDYQKDGDLRKNMDCSGRPSDNVLGEWDSFESGLPSNYHKDGELRTNMDHSRRSSESVLRDWNSFESIFPSNYQKDELRKHIDHPGSSNEIVLREWDTFESAFSTNYHNDGELRRNMNYSRRSSESVPREWDSFESGFPCDYEKDGELQKNMDQCGRSNVIVLREWDNPHSRFQSNYHQESKLENNYMHPDQQSKSRRSDAHHGFSFCLPFERLRSLGAFHFKDLDEFRPVVEQVREEHSRLEWVFKSGKDRPDRDSRQAMCHRPPNAWYPDQQGVLDNMLNANGFPASPLFSRRSLVKTLPECVRTACLMDEDQPEFNDVKYAMEEPRQFSLSFPYSPKCFPSADDRFAENNVSNGNIILSYREPRRPNKVWDCAPHSDSWRNCSAASEFSAEDHQSGYHAWQFPQNDKSLYSLALLKASPEESFASRYEGIEMNGTSNNGKIRNLEKAYPGCLGRMVNLFELNIGVSANRLLTDKPHRDGSPVSRSRSDVSSMGPSLDQIEEKVIVSEYTGTFSNKNSNMTPVKMLIAQEMCKEVDSRRSSPPNLVAKLMGLDSLPQQEPGSAMQRNHLKGHPRRHSEIPMSNWEQQNGFYHYVEPEEFKDVYEIWQQSKKSTRKGRNDESTKDKKMAFVRQKFVEAKRLSMDEKLRQSKQFQDALEVLNSNKDLFLKCLQEPNSVFSQQLYDLQSIPPPPETKRITVLRPSKMAGNHDFSGPENREEKQMEKCAFVQLNGLEKGHLGSSPSASWKSYENPAQPTRIVVLKPSLGKILDDKAVSSPQSQSARVHGEEFFGDEEDNENQESREVAKAITQQMREKLGRHHRDETLISSVFSNGYVADESSFNRSEIEYAAGNLSDSEAVSPVSRHSWDYVNRLGSPYSSSSFSRASYSPESSVCREAKKRLSERWAMMASSGSCQEQRHVRRSSSTLGEMLALSEAKKVASPAEEGSSNQESKDINSLLFSEQRINTNVDSSTINFMRSKSLPVSSNKLGTGLIADVSVFDKDKMEVLKEDRKVRSSKSSLKGKVSSFFSSKNKKTSKEKFLASETKDDCQSCPGDVISGKIESLIDKGTASLPANLMEPSNKASSSNSFFKQGLTSPEAELSMSEPIGSGNLTENQDQPSPISVLDPPFEDCDRTTKLFPNYGKPDQLGHEIPPNAISSNLIDKSPPIGSIARTLSWDDSCMDTASSYPIKESSSAQGTEEGEREWVLLVETLLSVAGLQGEMQPNSCLARWHSPESPLNPSLRDKYIDLSDKDTLHEAKRRQKRSMQKLVFDCLNAVLVDITGYGLGPGQRASESNINMLDEVWARMSGWFCSEVKCGGLGDGGDDNSLVVERVVRKEVVGSGWVDNLRLEVDNLGNEIEGKLLDELVVELTGRE